MNHGRSGEIPHPEFGQPAATPDPVTNDGINNGGDHYAVEKVGDKSGAFGHGA